MVKRIAIVIIICLSLTGCSDTMNTVERQIHDEGMV